MITDDSLEFFSVDALRRCAGKSEITRLQKSMNNRTMNFPVCYGIEGYVPHKCFCNEDGCNGRCEKDKCQPTPKGSFDVEWCEGQCQDHEVRGISKGFKVSTTLPIIVIMTVTALTTATTGLLFNTLTVIVN